MKYAIAVLVLIGAVHAEGESRKKIKRGHDLERLEKVIHQLNAGIKALKMIDRHEDAQHLADIVRELKHKMGATSERRVAQHQLEVLRSAFRACQEAEKAKWAEAIEHAIHARELRLEGRRDAEARRVYETQPSLGNVAELLMASSRLWKEFGHEREAKECMKLGKQFADKVRRQRPMRERAAKEEARAEKRERERARAESRERKRERERGEPRNRNREREHAREQQEELIHALRQALGRVEKLEKRLAEIEARLNRANRDG